LSQVSPGTLLLMGKVVRPHGRAGLLRIHSYARSQDSFHEAGRVFLRSVSGEIREYTVAFVRPHKNFFLMKLEGLSSRSQAEEYKGAEIYIRKGTLTKKEDEYFWYELLGLKVYLDNGECLGSISQVICKGSNDIYVIKKGNREILIPATYEVVRDIDLEKGKMTISAMEGLLDPNEI